MNEANNADKLKGYMSMIDGFAISATDPHRNPGLPETYMTTLVAQRL